MSLILIFTWEEKERKIQFLWYCYLFISKGVNGTWEYNNMHIARHVMGRRRSRDGRTILTFSFFVCVFVKNVVILAGVLPHRQL
jgi:hypothetical protein